MRGAPSTCISPLSLKRSPLSVLTPSFSLFFPSSPLFSSLLLLSLLLVHSAIFTSAADINTDAQALLAFKESTGNINNENLISWSSSAIASVCTTWFGVTCSNGSSPSPTQSNGSSALERVISLRLPAKSLYGEVPLNTIGKLDAIETLSLRGNKLSGELPADLLYNCTSLRRLFLQKNYFSGPLPLNVSSSWPLLLQLDLSSNSFSGLIPSSLSSPGRLKTLFLQNNSLSGPLPPINASSLSSFSVAYNNLSGPIPSSLNNFSADSFVGNDNLCGFPLPHACTNSTSNGTPPSRPSPNPNPNPTSSTSTQKTHSTHKLGAKVIVGIAVAILAAALIMVPLIIFCFCKICNQGSSMKKKQGDVNDVFKEGYEGGGAAQQSTTEYQYGGGGMTKSAEKARERKGQSIANQLIFLDKKARPMFDLEELLRASAEVLGKGSLGTAYKAMMDDGMIVVVKRLREVMCENEDFMQRMDVLGRLHHPNLVPPRAYYFAKTEKLLVLDYMPHGSLSALLHGNLARLPLDWGGRLSVAHTVARVMAYLHSQKVVHGNLKSSNVLLGSNEEDGAMWGVADYGLVQLALFSPTSNVKLMGYIAPEISNMQLVTPRADVYSYGVLLLELLTGKSPILTAFDDHTLDLPKWVHASLLRNPNILKSPNSSEALFDPFLLKIHDIHTHDDMIQLLHISLLCTSHSPHQRPSMADVVTMIDNLQKPEDNDIEEEDMYYGHHE